MLGIQNCYKYNKYDKKKSYVNVLKGSVGLFKLNSFSRVNANNGRKNCINLIFSLLSWWNCNLHGFEGTFNYNLH